MDFKVGDFVKVIGIPVWGTIIEIDPINLFGYNEEFAITVEIDNAGKDSDPFMYNDKNGKLINNLTLHGESWEKITEHERFILNLKG